MRSLPLSSTKLTDPFWSRWQRTLIEVTLPSQYRQLEETGRLENFERAAKGSGEFQGLWFNDSDVYKFAEACAYALAIKPDDAVQSHLESAITLIQGAQEPNGYLNTFFQLKHPDLKWQNLSMMHEMYCGGHLIEAAVAVFECLDDQRLLHVATRFADHVASIFGPDGRRGYCGHEEIELALLRLAKATGESRFSELANWMVEERGKAPSPFELELDQPATQVLAPFTASMLRKDGKYSGEYCQDHAPIRKHTQVVGHAVRAMYFYIAAAELADSKQDVELETALESTWSNLTQRRMYITGGIGPSASNEGFTTDFDLPNLSAYAETCASCGLVFWGHKMLELTGNSDYADVVERALYNGVLSGISISGDHYFYANPLESRGTHQRVPWFTCACCPPNIARIIGSVSQYVAGASSDRFYLHIPVGLETSFEVNGIAIDLKIDSNYPWSGKIKVLVEPKSPVKFGLCIRIPHWSEEMEIDLPGAEEPAEYDNGYAVFERIWKPGEGLSIDFGMTPRWVQADPRVRDNLGRIALTQGPLIYTLEEADAGFVPQLFSANADSEVVVGKSKLSPDIVTLTVSGIRDIEPDSDELYVEEGSLEQVEAACALIPYYAWNNRGANSMQVWLRQL